MATLTSSLATSMNLKTPIHNFIIYHVFRIARAVTKAKSVILELLKAMRNIHFLESLIIKKDKNKNKLYFGLFRFHYNWCSSHGIPISSPNPYNNQLSGYLQWLEEKNMGDDKVLNGARITVVEKNEIDRLANKFIANCHEKFRLEKQVLNRRFQEMMVSSV